MTGDRYAAINPNSEGVPAPHLSEGGLIQPPPGKCSINGPNWAEILCVTSHGLFLSPWSKN